MPQGNRRNPPGEKLHEEMITLTDSIHTIEFEKYFVLLPSVSLWNINEFMERSAAPDARKTSHTTADPTRIG